MSVLITGASGLLGKYLIKSGNSDFYGTWFTNTITKENYYRMDLSNKSQVMYIFDRLRPDIVIHCAAIGNVDFTENNYQAVRAINYDGTANIINMCKEYKSRLVYISTNAVYSGNNPPYQELSPQNPVNAYGVIKKSTEQLVRSLMDDWIIIRPFMLYGQNRRNGRKNWLTIIKAKLEKNESLKLVNDVYWQPTSVKDVAKGILQLCNDWKSGESYNVSCEEKITLYDFGLLVADKMGLVGI